MKLSRISTGINKLRLAISVLSLILMCLCGCGKSEEIGHYSTGEVEYRVPLDDKGIYDGICTYFYKNGIKKSEIPFVNHHTNGTLRRYYPSGNLMSTAVYKNGRQWGDISSYYLTGEVRSIGKVYGEVPRGPMRYFYRNGKLQHLRIYDKTGHVADFAEFTPNGKIDGRFTQPLVYTTNDTVKVGARASFEVVLASRTSVDIQIKIDNKDVSVDSGVGVFSRFNYMPIFYKSGKQCIYGKAYQREHHRDTILTKVFPWKHYFYVINN